MPPPPEAATGRRLALIIASWEYQDPTLQRLRAPGRDAEALAAVLRDPAIGAFEMRTLLNLPSAELFRGIAEFCANSSPPDLLLVYLSCHGVLDDRGRLYYASVDTERRLLAATSVPAQWLNDQLEDCAARLQLLILDCCHSGAFAKGMKGDASLALQDRFGSRGRMVLTASRATEYSFEGNQVLGQGISSVFTTALVQGLQTGDADRDRDGLITVTELYEHVYDRTRAADARQTPALWTYGAEGNVLVARSPRGAAVTPVALAEDLRSTLESPRPRVRESAVAELADLLDQGESGLALTARLTLERVAEGDIPRVAALARVALAAGPGRAAELVHGEVEERARRYFEEQTRRTAEAQARREAEEQTRQEAEGEARRAAEEQARLQAEEQARQHAEQQAEQQARRDTQEQARRDTQEQARRDTQEQARREAEEQARSEEQERTRRGSEDQARREAEEQDHRDAEEAGGRARGEADDRVGTEARRKARVPTLRRAAILWTSLGVAIVVVLISYLRWARPTDTTMLSRVPGELRPSCTAGVQTSASCALDDGSHVIYNLYHTADDARTNVVSPNAIAPDSDPCPTSAPPTENPIVCHYTVGTQKGVVKLSYINKDALRFYSILWNPDGQPVTGFMSSPRATPTAWATLTAEWGRVAAMR
jgi:Caspase domain